MPKSRKRKPVKSKSTSKRSWQNHHARRQLIDVLRKQSTAELHRQELLRKASF